MADTVSEATLTVVTTRQLSPVDVWREKEALVARQQNSRRLWNESTDDERVGTLLLVRDQLERLLDRVETWVPGSLARNGDRLDVTMSIHLPEVTDAVVRSRVEIERAQQEQAMKLLDIRRTLDS